MDSDAAPGGDGTSWDTAYRFLRDALDEAANIVALNEIRVAEGVYRPHLSELDPNGPMASDCCEIHDTPGCDNAECEAVVCGFFPACCDTAWDESCLVLFDALCDPDLCIVTDLRLMSFDLVNGLVLRGGYAGQGAPDPDARDIELYETILTGDQLGDDGPDFANNDENSHHVVTGYDIDVTPELDGFTVTAGNGAAGAGLHVLGGSATIRDCRFVGNNGGNGGGAAGVSGTVSFLRCVFEFNRAAQAGGLYGIGEITLTDCIFLDNHTGSMSAGAVKLGGTIATVTDCRFEGNVAGMNVGGLWAESDTVVVVGCDFIGNGAGGAAGGASLSASSLAVRDCTFIDNQAGESGGALSIAGEGIVENCIFQGNLSQEQGGAITFWRPSEALPIVNCTFTGNIAVECDGGAIDCPITSQDGHLVVRNSTFSGNTAGERGGAIRTHEKSVTIEDCHFESNQAGTVGGACWFRAQDEDDAINVLRCTLTGNTSDVTGGGMYVLAARSTITDSNFLLNSTFYAGGLAMHIDEAIVARCLFAGNISRSEGGGASVLAHDPGAVFEDCTFVGNSAVLGGGLHSVAISSDPLLSVVGCRFFGNHAFSDDLEGPGRGGGVYLEEIDSVLLNSIFSGNTAEETGGALYIETASNSSSGDVVDVINCTLSENTALENTGGAFGDNHGDGTTFNNCILWGNVDSTGTTRSAQIEVGAPTSQMLVNYSCIQGWDGAFDGVGNIDDDPLLVEPDGADGDVGTDDDDLRLQPSSPCIDAGDNTAVPEDITADLDGNPRFLEIPETPDTGNGTLPIVDMGAYESLGGGCLAITSQEIVCHADGTTFTVNVDGLNACTGGTTQVTFTASGGAVGQELCFTALVNDGGFCCTTEICVTIPDCAPAALPSDLDGDGIVGMVDFLALLAAWGSCSDCSTPQACPADFDGDCSVGILDLLVLLGNWGP